MASIKLYLDTRHQRKDGTHALKLTVSHRGAFHISLNVYLKPEQWIGGEVFVPENSRKQKELDTYIKSRYSAAENTLYKLRALGRLDNMTDKDLRYAIENTTIEQPEDEPLLFITHYNTYVNALSKQGTRAVYTDTLRKLKQFTDIQNLTFKGINYAFLKDFERFMSGAGLAINTMSIHMRNIRTIFNDAIDRDLIDQGLYPFRKFKIKKEATRKRSLTLDQLKQFRDYECESTQEQYRDIFMLIFYLCGINMVDLCNLREITSDGYIEYKRAKTGRLYKIKVEPEAREIIDRYRGKDYLLNILDRYRDYHNYLHRLNKNISEIGPIEYLKTNNTQPKGNRVKSGPDKQKRNGLFPDLSTYWARHSWASIAAGLDIPKETIAAALGHGGNTVTDIYIAFDQKKIDKANRIVLDALK